MDRVKIKISGVQFDAYSAEADRHFMRALRRYPHHFGHVRVTLYTWDCAKTAKQNGELPTTYTVRPFINFRAYTPTMRIDQRWTQAAGRFAATSGLKSQTALEAALFKELGGSRHTLTPDRQSPAGKLAHPGAKPPVFGPRVKLRLVLTIYYIYFWIDRVSPGRQDRFLLGIPSSHEIGWIVEDYCDSGPPPRKGYHAFDLPDWTPLSRKPKQVQKLFRHHDTEMALLRHIDPNALFAWDRLWLTLPRPVLP